MNNESKIIDYVLTTQLCTVISVLSMYGAHVLDKLDLPNWNWGVYVLLFVGCMFMLLPYLFWVNDLNKAIKGKDHAYRE